ncbi:RluA family pseudouridine synthase [Alphaproteobacteria bacterium]|nr:RluA family pseudouridine synthase [Alphaproteobacteria bacterium]
MINPIKISLSIKDFDIPYDRLDVWVTEAIKVSSYAKQQLNDSNLSLSRSRIKKLIEGKNIRIDGVEVKDPSFKIKNSELITIQFPPADNPIPLPENIDLEILYEDQYIIILNKQAGIVVHPAPGSPNGTLVNALLYHCGKSLEGIGGVKRPGIVHRLDKNTSGVMVVAKTETAHVNLCKIFSNHDLDRRYNAIVWGQPANIGIIEKPIGRSAFNRKKMAISLKGKVAITKWKVLDVYAPLASLIECKLETGKTHQIRVHLSDMGHSVIGDDLYGKSLSENKYRDSSYKEKIRSIKFLNRQALHATKLSLNHPITKKYIEFISPLPKDIIQLIEIFKKKY